MKLTVFATLLASAAAFGINKADLGKVSKFGDLMGFQWREPFVSRVLRSIFRIVRVSCRARAERRLIRIDTITMPSLNNF
jgi:hypothetical protein